MSKVVTFSINLYLSYIKEVISEDQIGGPIIPKSEAEIVFGKLIPIYQLHDSLQTRLADLEKSWNPDTSRLGELLLPFMDEFEKVCFSFSCVKLKLWISKS